MLKFIETPHGLITEITDDGRNLMDAYIGADHLASDALYEWFAPFSDRDWILIDADKINGNSTDAPVFLNRKRTTRSKTDQYGNFDLINGEMYFYHESKINCFAEKIDLQNSAFFTRA